MTYTFLLHTSLTEHEYNTPTNGTAHSEQLYLCTPWDQSMPRPESLVGASTSNWSGHRTEAIHPYTYIEFFSRVRLLHTKSAGQMEF